MPLILELMKHRNMAPISILIFALLNGNIEKQLLSKKINVSSKSGRYYLELNVYARYCLRSIRTR